MNIIADNITKIKNKISSIISYYGRTPDSVKLLAVSKSRSINEITKAIEGGQTEFGESYINEGVKKILYFKRIQIPNLKWHFIGSIQSNKSRLIAEYFDWCQTVNSLRIAKRLDEQRKLNIVPLNILIQINISGESSKLGIELTELDKLSIEISRLKNLKLRGLMAIPAPENNYDRQFSVAQRMAELFNLLKAKYQTVDTLSLGMSKDIETAIRAGSTMVRIGTAIFCSNKYLP